MKLTSKIKYISFQLTNFGNMNKTYILLIISSYLIFQLLSCTRPIQTSSPQKSQFPDIAYTHITLECLQKSNNGYPFVELSLFIANTGQRYYIATVYGQIYKTFNAPPLFAPPDSICGVAIKNNTTIHYFFVCANATTGTLEVQSLIEKLSDNYNNTMDYTTIITIPTTLHNIIKSNVIVK